LHPGDPAATPGGDSVLQRFSPCCNGPESRINDSKARRISGFLKAVRFNLRTDRLKANVYRLERFHNSRALTNVLWGGFFLVKKPLGSCGPTYDNCGTAVSN
jgi:hypothetical protein